MEELQANAKNELASLNIKDLFYKYVRFLPLFIISIAMLLFGAYVYLRYATLIYSSSGTMVIQDDKSSSGSNDRFDELLKADNTKNIQNEIEYLKSAKLMSRVVTALNLNLDYKAIGNIKTLDVYKAAPFHLTVLELNDSSSAFTLSLNFNNPNTFQVNGSVPVFTFGQVFKNEYGVFRLNKVPEQEAAGQYKVSWTPTSSVAAGLAGSIGIAPKQNTGILVLSFESTNPNFSADVINQLMIEYGKATIEDKNQETQNKLNFIDKRLAVVGGEVDSITRKRLNFLKQNQLFDLESQSTSQLQKIEEADKERTIQNSLLNKTFLIEDNLVKRSIAVPVPSSLGLEDPTLNSLVLAYNQAQIERKSLQQNAPEGNIAVIQNRELLDRLSKNIQENLRNIKQALSSMIGDLDRVRYSAQSAIQVMPEKQQSLVELQRQLEGKEDIYKSFLVERERSQIILASTISNIRILTDAKPNYAPVKPNKNNIRMLAIVIGLVLPALFIFGMELLNDKVTTRHDIEKFTTCPILGEVGHSFGKQNLVATHNNRSVVAEQFRIIRSNLQYVLNNIEKPVILVTSSFSGEGKSFISTNIGAVMALAGKRTIILEFDIRKPKILSHLNIPKKPGLTNYLLGKLALHELAIPVPETENLFVLSCGPVPPNPSELLLNPKLNELFTYLRANFDTVIMDTAPVGMVSDAMTLSKYSDCTMYIVRQGHTYKKQIGIIDEFYRQAKLPKISLILNDVKVRTGYGYYGYGRYGYGYGYGSGYFDDEEIRQQTAWHKWFGWLDTKRWKKKKKTKAGRSRV